MKLIDLIESFDASTINTSEKKTRRETLGLFGEITKKIAIATAPGALLAALPSVANAAGNGPQAVVDVLRFALLLENLESAYYTQGVSSGVIASGDLSIFNTIKDHEVAHVSVLQGAITSLGGSYGDIQTTFDFTGNGAYTPFTNYQQFLALSQAFEDTGVRAYKGQAGNLMGTDATTRDILKTALQIHSVEARHAAEVRRLRGNKGWITGNDATGLPAAIYAGEELATQAGASISAINGVGADAATESFDEPLTQQQVTDIATPFL